MWMGGGGCKMHKLDCRLADLPSRQLGLFKSIGFASSYFTQTDQARAPAQSQFIFIKSKTFTRP